MDEIEPSETWPPIRWRQLVLIVFTGVAIVICALIAAPFLSPLAWALALAVLFAPLHRRMENKLRRPNVSALVSVFFVTLIVLLPLVLVGGRLFSEAAEAASAIRAKAESGDWLRAIGDNPRLAPVARWIQENTDLPAAIGTAASWLTSQGASLVRGSVVQMLGFLVTIYLLFFFLRDRKAISATLHRMSPLPESAMGRLGARVQDTIHAIVYGILVIAVVQGLLGGLMFWWLGFSAPLLWGIVMGLLAVIPLLGAYIVWMPAALVLLAEGHWIKALILAIWGAIVVGGIDNLLYPVLIGNRLKMHTVLAFIALVGGLILLGPSGILLGPIVVTITLSLLETWRDMNAAAEAPRVIARG